MQARLTGNKKILIIISLGILLVIGCVWWYTALRPGNTSSETPAVTNPTEDTSKSQSEDSLPDTDTTQEVVADPSAVSTVDIAPLGVAVSYVKGIQGFEYVIQRTQSNTQYVDFMSSQLIGTKCTDDKGVFASIIQDPAGVDAATISASREVGGRTYGLSLPDATCTGDTTLFKQYQQSFKDAFGLLRAVEPAADSME